jgi:hypothetical protein
MAFPRAATMETAMNGFRNSVLWPVDPNVFTRVDFSPSVVTHAAKLPTPKQTLGYNGYIPVEKISLLPSNSAERPRPESRKKNTAFGVNWDTTQGITE